MIDLQRGDILKAEADALVNTVNCVGVMGRGIALQFKKAFPENYKAYEAACKRKQLKPGDVLTHDLNRFEQPHYVINLATKKHWRGKSRMEYVESGLENLVAEVERLGITSIAVPPLGCGLGGLDWTEVRRLIMDSFAVLPNVRVLLYEPKGAPSAQQMAKEERRPRMTKGRALLIGLMRRYLAAVMDPDVSLLEIHKLMYFMQESGEDLRLQFSKGLYGPYAENLRHVLTRIEGHFILGYGDAADEPHKPIQLLPEAVEQAESFLADHAPIHQRYDRVARLIAGFESSFGMELLATVHWVAVREGAKEFGEALAKTHAWNTRKRMFSDEHVHIALEALQEGGWLANA